jgi:hypothetical protein
MKRKAAVLVSAMVICVAVAAQAQHQHDHSAQAQTPNQILSIEELERATDAMSGGHGDHMDGSGAHADGHDHHMGPHMKMSALKPAQPGDDARAAKIVEQAKAAIAKYKDPAAAEADGFRLFLPQVKHQKQYHYTNHRNAFAAAFKFDPAKPTSLLYADGKDGKKQLIGLMYTAPARFSEEQLAERIPASVAQWHQHVNLCVPPKAQRDDMFKPDAKFGLRGSISTEAECKAAGGTFKPRIFGWMVHMYPWEKTPDAIWSVERQKVENMMPSAGRASR